MRVDPVTFPSGGLRCAGDLYRPEGDGPHPAIVLGAGFGSTKPSLRPHGEFFARAGYTALAIDYRTCGESEGEPRGQIFPLDQVEDYRNAVSYLEAREDVDAARIGIWGMSFAGGVVLYAAAFDRRVRAVVSQTPVVNGWRWAQGLRPRGEWEALLDQLDEDRRTRYRSGAGRRIPHSGAIYSAMPFTPHEIAQIAEWREAAGGDLPMFYESRITLESMERVIAFAPDDVIDRIAPRPVCMIAVSGFDAVHPLDQIQEAYQRAGEPKELVLLPYRQFGLYHEPGQTKGLEVAAAWFDRHLGPAAG